MTAIDTDLNAYSDATMVAPLDPAKDGGKREIVFVDSSVADAATLALEAAAQRPGAEVVLFNGHGNGVQEIASFLAANNITGLDAVHIMSHGTTGAVTLGTETLDDATLASQSASLAEISAALKPQGDILLYGCDTAQGSTGQHFINGLSAITGDVVAASTDLTGSASLGGNWNLEASTAPVATSAIAVTAYDGVLLSPVTITPEPAGGNYAVNYTVNYDISGSPVAVDTIIAVTEAGVYTESGNYTGGSLEFRTTDNTASDALDIARTGTASVVAGALSVSSGGNGLSRQRHHRRPDRLCQRRGHRRLPDQLHQRACH